MRGRTLVGVVLAAFVIVALSIVWRRTIGIGESERLALLDSRRAERLTGGCVADFAFEPSALAFQSRAFRLELGQALGFTDADRPPPDDGQRDEHERAEDDSDESPAPHAYAALCHARSLALRERGLRAVSFGLAVVARLVRSSPRDFPRQVHWSCLGGQMQEELHSRMVCLTRRSSPE